jgi:hypothetical protein
MSEPIGMSYGGFPIYPISSKKYRCIRCGNVEEHSTNHYARMYAYCYKCPPLGRPSVWECLETPDTENNQPEDRAMDDFDESVLHEADRLLLPAPKENDTLVIHKSDPSTDFLKAIYEGKGCKVISGDIRREDLMEKIKKFPRIFMLGHGAPHGLFGPGYIIGDEFGPLLRQKTGLYVWCHAVEYAHHHKLSGLVSGMFISEVGEAAYMGIKATQREVDASNAAFAQAVRRYLDTGSSPHEVKNCYNSATCKVTQYNNERLYVMEQGTILDSLGQPQSDDVSAKEGSPRYWQAHPNVKPPWWQRDKPVKRRPKMPDTEPDMLHGGLRRPDSWPEEKDDFDDFKFESKFIREADNMLPRRPDQAVDDLMAKAAQAKGKLAQLQQHPDLQGKKEIRSKIDDLMGKMNQRDVLLARLKFQTQLDALLRHNGAIRDQVEALIPGRETPFGKRPSTIAGVALKGGKRIMFTLPVKYPPESASAVPPKASNGMPPPPIPGAQDDIVDPSAPTGGSLAAESRH